MVNRIKWIDVAKGVLIILVVLGHCHVNSVCDMIINSFHMAAFFSLSGVTFNVNRTFKEFLNRKLKSLIEPYLVFCAIYLLYQYSKTLFFSDTRFNLLSGLVSIIVPVSGRNATSVYGLWFFPCLFIAEIFFYILLKLYSSSQVGALLLFLAVSSVCFENFCQFGVASIISILPFATAFLCLGRCLSGINRKVIEYKMVIFITSLVIFISAVAVNFVCFTQSVDLSSMNLGCVPLYIISSVAGTILVYLFAVAIPKNRILQFLGKDSMYYYGLHYEVVGVAEKIIVGGGTSNDLLLCCYDSNCLFL